MKREVIVPLIVFFLVLAPIASADNFLTGSSIFDKIGDVYAKSVDFLKELFAKEESVGVPRGADDIEEDEPQANPPSQVTPTHSECNINNACLIVNGAGENQCNTDSDCEINEDQPINLIGDNDISQNICGDDKIAEEEECDGIDFGGLNCQSFDFDRGYLH